MKAFIYIIPVIILCSCSNNHESEYPIKTIIEKYKNGSIKEVKITTDSNSFSIIRYNENGVLIDSVPFVDNDKNGTRKYFDVEKKLYFIVEYEDDLKNGLEKVLYKNGNIKYLGKNKTDIPIGEWKFFNIEGNIISYEFYTSQGERKYLRNYDEDANLTNSMGEGLIELLYRSDSITAGEEFISRITLVSPPNCNSSVIRGDIDERGNKSNLFLAELKEKDNNTILYTEKFNRPGRYKKVLTWKIQDTLTNTIEEGEKYFYINVTNK